MEPRLPFWLTLLGAVPFVFFSICIAFEWTSNVAHTLNLLLIYAAIVFAFLGGIHWGLAILCLHEFPHASVLMLCEGVVSALLAWALFAWVEPPMQLLGFAFLFVVLWGIDSLLYNNKIIPLWFFNLRGIATPIVVVSLYVAYFSIT